MKFLIDTHVFLWFILNDLQLSNHARDLIIEPHHEISLSPASHWEIAIKVSLGKYQILGDFQAWFEGNLQANRFAILPIEVSHTAIVTKLPFYHKDPFDRLLIAQAMAEQVPIISADAVFDAYGVSQCW